MFVLEGSNNQTDNALSAAYFELGTGQPCYGALIAICASQQRSAIAGLEGDKKLFIPIPTPVTNTVEVSVKGLRIRRLEAIEYMERRYTRSMGEPTPGEFYWDIEREVLHLMLLG